MARGKRKRPADKRPAARSIENPSVPFSAAFWSDTAADALGAERTSSGVRVTERKALGYPAVWRAVSLISGDVAKLSLLVYRTVAAEGKEVDRTHPAYRICRYKANPYLLAFDFKRVVQLHALLRGNGYAFIDRDGVGRPTGLHVLDSDRVEPFRVDGEVVYQWTPAEDRKLKPVLIPAADVFHIKGLGDDGLAGYPALKVLRDSLGAAIAARDYGARNFKNSGRPGGVLTHPGQLKPEARKNMRESWDRLHGGVDNAHRIAILEEGVTFTPISASARDAQLLESREFDSREIANIFGVPAHKLGDPSKVAYNSLGEENQSYFDDTLSHWLGQWSSESSEKLLSEEEKLSESHCIDFDYRQVKRANLASLTTYATSAVGKWASVDEVRDAFGDNPLPNGQGRWQAPAPPAAPAIPDKTPAPPVADKPARSGDGLRAVVEDAARRMARRIVGDAGKYKGDPAGFAEWVDGRRDYHGDAIRSAFGPTALLCQEGGLPGMGVEDIVGPFWSACRGQLADTGPERLSMAADAIVDHVAKTFRPGQ